MKVIIQIEHFDPFRGGAETYAALFCQDLIGHGHEVEVMTMSWGNIPPGVKVTRVKPAGITRWQRWISFVSETRKLSQKSGADCILAMNRGGGMDVFQPHGGTIPGSQRQNMLRQPGPATRAIKMLSFTLGPKAVIARMLDREAYRTAKRFVALSRMVFDDMRRYYQVPTEKIHLIYNGVDTVRFNPSLKEGLGSGLRKEYNIPEKAFVFSLVAHNFSLKGVDALIRAAARVKKSDCYWLIAGKGRKGRFLSLAKDLGIDSRIVFAGPVERVEEVYAASNAYVHPTWYDPCSLVVLEALAMGLPVITTRFNGAGELLEEGKSGFVIDHPADHRRLAECMERMADRNVCASMGEEARRLAEKHTWEDHFDDMRKILFLK